MKKRWICLLVENEIGVLAKVSGLFSGKSYNLHNLTVGTTEDESISRMTISLTSDDQTFEQVKKQLNRCIEIIKVVDFTDIALHTKELMFIKILNYSHKEKVELSRMESVFHIKVIDHNNTAILLESVHTEDTNNEIARSLKQIFCNRIEIVRGGNIAIETLSISKQDLNVLPVLL